VLAIAPLITTTATTTLLTPSFLPSSLTVKKETYLKYNGDGAFAGFMVIGSLTLTLRMLWSMGDMALGRNKVEVI